MRYQTGPVIQIVAKVTRISVTKQHTLWQLMRHHTESKYHTQVYCVLPDVKSHPELQDPTISRNYRNWK